MIPSACISNHVNPVTPSELVTVIYLLPTGLKLNVGLFEVVPVVTEPVTLQYNTAPLLVTVVGVQAESLEFVVSVNNTVPNVVVVVVVVGETVVVVVVGETVVVVVIISIASLFTP